MAEIPLWLHPLGKTHVVGPTCPFTNLVSGQDVTEVLEDMEPRPGSSGSHRSSTMLRPIRRKLRPGFWPHIADTEPWTCASEECDHVYARDHIAQFRTHGLDPVYCERPLSLDPVH